MNDITPTAAAQENARTEVLGALEGPCCTPHEDPCLTCLPPDEAAERLAWTREHEARILAERMAEDVAYIPSDEDDAWLREQTRREEDRYYAERVDREADARLAVAVMNAARAGTFREMVAGMANAFIDHRSSDVRGLGDWIGELARDAVAVEATNWEQFADRRDAARDAMQAG